MKMPRKSRHLLLGQRDPTVAACGTEASRQWWTAALDLPLSVRAAECLGLRVGEAQSLELRDVNLKVGELTIRGAKLGKSRLVPMHASTRTVLADYIAQGERMWGQTSGVFFIRVQLRQPLGWWRYSP